MASSLLPGGVETPLLQRSAYFGKLDQLKRLVKQVEKEHKGEKIGEVLGKLKDGNGCTVLHMAAINGKTQICKYLLKDLKVNVDVKDSRDATPLHQATLGDHYATAVYLLDNGANPNAACTEGFTPLHFAAKRGHKKLVKLLISRGSEVNAMSHDGTPLQVSAGQGRIDCVKILLDNHAEPNVFYQPSPSEAYRRVYSPLVGAVYANSVEGVKLLLQAGADPNIGSPLEIALGDVGIEIVECLLAAGANPNTPNIFDLKPIELAAIEGCDGVVQLLFPATAPIAEVTDWSPDGIMKYVHTDESVRKRMKKREEAFWLMKSQGEAAFMKKDYMEAASHFIKCSFIMDPSDETASSYRSLCSALMSVERAYLNGQICPSLIAELMKER